MRPRPPDLPSRTRSEDEPIELEPTDAPALPLDPRGGAPEDHVSFDDFWASLGLEPTPACLRERELFYEWLGQNGYDVHRRDEPTILGDAAGWREAWARWQRCRKLR